MIVCIIGALGNMGKRYCSILKYLGHEVVEYDVNTDKSLGDCLKGVHRAIVATPTGAHENFFSILLEREIPFLCEKPVSLNLGKLDWLQKESSERKVPVSQVCNWRYVRGGLKPNNHKVRYNYFKTGSDGMYTDCIQLLQLSQELGTRNYDVSIRTNSPVFDCEIDDQVVTLDDIDTSYLMMIEDFCSKPDALWGVQEAKEGANRVASMKRTR